MQVTPFDEPTTISPVDNGGGINLSYPHRPTNADLKPAWAIVTPLICGFIFAVVWLVVKVITN